jgi:hypothetical protein
MKIKTFRTCRKSVRRKNCEKDVTNISEEERSVGKPRKRWYKNLENELK